MSKLRIIQERTKLNEDAQDLRGLGNSSIITKTDIEPHLIFKYNDSNEVNLELQDLLLKFNCNIISQFSSQSIKVVSTRSHVNYKVNCIFLFNLSLQLIQKKISSSIDLGEIDWLRMELCNAVVDKYANKSPKYEKSENTERGILISPIYSQALSQAGYKIQASFNNTFLTEYDIANILTHLKHIDSLKSKNSRAA